MSFVSVNGLKKSMARLEKLERDLRANQTQWKINPEANPRTSPKPGVEATSPSSEQA